MEVNSTFSWKSECMQGIWVQSLARELRPHMLQSYWAGHSGACVPQQESKSGPMKIPHAATKTRHSQINKYLRKNKSLIYLLLFFKIFIYLFIHLTASSLSCGMWDLLPWSGIEPWPPALGAWKLSHWTTR